MVLGDIRRNQYWLFRASIYFSLLAHAGESIERRDPQVMKVVGEELDLIPESSRDERMAEVTDDFHRVAILLQRILDGDEVGLNQRRPVATIINKLADIAEANSKEH